MSDRCDGFLRSGNFKTEADGKPYECDVCKMEFKHLNSLAIHKTTHNTDRPHECDVCLMRFTHPKELIKHKKAHASLGYECDLCKKILSRPDSLANHRKTHKTDKPHECDVCLMRFIKANELMNHKKIHISDNPCECNVSRSEFSEPDLLPKQKRKQNGRGRFYKCSLCPSTFFDTVGLDWHNKEHLFCNDCNKGIVEPQELQVHFLKDKHTGKYVCNKCYRNFAEFVKLVEHIARLHSNDAKYRCSFCQELESTVPTGIGYICCVCDVVFDVPRDLEAHMITHNTAHAE